MCIKYVIRGKKMCKGARRERGKVGGMSDKTVHINEGVGL